MQLHYRGATYDYNPAPSNAQVFVSDSDAMGQYRGAHFKFHHFRVALRLQPAMDLIYRGVHFRGGSPTVGVL